MDMRLKYKVRAQQYTNVPYSFGGTNWNRILMNSETTIGSENVLAAANDTVSGRPVTLAPSFILPDTWNGELIDGNVFCNVRVGIEKPSDGYAYVSDVDVDIKKINSSGALTSLSGVVALLDGGNVNGPLSQDSDTPGIKYGQIFGWVPVYAEINSGEHIVVEVRVTATGTLSPAKVYTVYSADSDDTYFIFPLV